MAIVRNEKGVTLLEVLTVVAVMMLLTVGSIFTVSNILPTLRADSGLEQVLIQLRQARLNSIDQRRDFTVTFTGTHELVVVRQEVVPTPCPCPTTAISDTFLPQGMVYMLFTGPPALPDTPDLFGKANALNFNCPGGVAPCSILFQSDGSVLSNGVLLNGTVFMGIAGNAKTARAVTVMGSTGRMRGYHCTGTVWF